MPVSAAPCTIAAWFQTTTTAGSNRTIVCLADATVNTDYMRLLNFGTQVYAQSATSDGQANSNTGSISANTWVHGAAVFASATSRTAYCDGSAAVTNTTSRAPSVTRTSIGRLGRLNPADYHDGIIAEASIWNVALTAGEILALSKGAHPAYVRPGSLVWYVPLFGADSPEPDLTVGSRDMTLTNSPGSAVHAPVGAGVLHVPKWFELHTAAAPAATQRLLSLTGVGK